MDADAKLLDFCFVAFSSREPVSTSLENALEPPLAALEALEVLEALALLVAAAEVKLLDVFVVAQFVSGAVEHHLALLHDVAVAGDAERGAGVLLDQQNGDAEVAVDAGDD